MTTLLVCLLETAGFNSAITIIKWRIDEYTHVFAEVWYDNDWFLLDPTLGSQSFGKQDKKINEFKRTTKQNMAKSDSTVQMLNNTQLRKDSEAAKDSIFFINRTCDNGGSGCGHVGFVEYMNGNFISTIEGNTPQNPQPTTNKKSDT